MQIKNAMRYHLASVRMAITKKSTNNKHWKGSGKKGTLLHDSWKGKLVQVLWKTAGQWINCDLSRHWSIIQG